MKIRSGFVSNSSSSSFCIYGAFFENSKYPSDEMEKKAAEAGLTIEYGPPYTEGVYIGRGYDTLGDNETGAQFKQSVVDKLAAVGLNEAPSYCEQGWYDG